MELRQPSTEEKIELTVPFKLCFKDRGVPGRSNIKIGKPINIPNVVTDKFYRRPETQENIDSLIDKYLKQLNVRGPREIYTRPKTENQKYGWYQIKLTDADWSDRRLFFHKRENILIKEHLMNYAKIRE